MEDVVPLLVFALVYLPQAVILARHDGADHRLPNRNVLVLTLTTAAALGLWAIASPATWTVLRPALVVAVASGLIAVVLALLAPSMLGMGDAKCLAAVVLMATVLGGGVLLAGALLCIVLSGILALGVGLREGTGASVPIGPVLLAMPALGLLGAPLLERALGIS